MKIFFKVKSGLQLERWRGFLATLRPSNSSPRWRRWPAMLQPALSKICSLSQFCGKYVPVLLALNKPFGVISQFTDDGSGNRTLAEFGFAKNIYPLGRLDADSEGLLLLSDEPGLNEQLLHPSHAHRRIYWAQVERIPTADAMKTLARGVMVQGRKTLPCRTWILEPQPEIPPRIPPIRMRKSIPDCWIGLELVEGKNRQVRRMTAAIGHPTLRLIRVQIGELCLDALESGKWKILDPAERALVFSRRK